MAKKFFYVCAGVLMLVGAYAIGANTAVAELYGDPVAAIWGTSGTYNNVGLVTVTGDYYGMRHYNNDVPADGDFHFVTNLYNGPVATEGATIGGIKSQFK